MPTAGTFRIGSRPSRLALAQAEIVKRRLEQAAPHLALEIVPIRTSGDRMASASLANVGGKGLFVRELEQALTARRVDIAIHSMKDLPAKLASGFRIAVVLERDDPRDALVTHRPGGLAGLPKAARIGTSSSRRRFQMLRMRPDLSVMPLRGNVDTRLDKVARGELDAIIVAAAGLKRLGRSDGLNIEMLDEREFIPAAAQAALAIEALAETPAGSSRELELALEKLNDFRALAETGAERAFLATLGASCASPVAVRATVADGGIAMRARLFSIDGSKELFDELAEPFEPSLPAAAAFGARLARRMLERGAADLIEAFDSAP
jgi:hydroxymethylbilane synthase